MGREVVVGVGLFGVGGDRGEVFYFILFFLLFVIIDVVIIFLGYLVSSFLYLLCHCYYYRILVSCVVSFR